MTQDLLAIVEHFGFVIFLSTLNHLLFCGQLMDDFQGNRECFKHAMFENGELPPKIKQLPLYAA